eukprot:Gb_01147 [translate_table: standard]
MFLQSACTATAIPFPVSLGCSLPLPSCRNRRPRPTTAGVPHILKELFGESFGSWKVAACMVANDNGKPSLNIKLLDATKRSAQSFSVQRKVAWRVRQEAERASEEEFPLPQKETPAGSSERNELKQVTPSFTTGVLHDPLVYKLRTQLGSLHSAPIPSPPLTRTVIALFGFFFVVGVVFDKAWTSRKTNKQVTEARTDIRPQVPTGLSRFLENELQRKESVEWVNMVLGKLWKVYRLGIENWLVGLLQPLIDNLKKPDYVARVEIKQFSLGEEPISVRSVERRTSRRANDLQMVLCKVPCVVELMTLVRPHSQCRIWKCVLTFSELNCSLFLNTLILVLCKLESYWKRVPCCYAWYQIGLRYTGGARMLLMLSLKFGILPIMIPVGVRDLDVDGELWVKLRLVPSEPWVGAATWAFVSLPKIKLDLAPFRLFNLMGMHLES